MIYIKKIKKFAKEGSYVAIGQLISILGTLLLIRLLTQYLSPGEYGELALGLSLGGLITQVIMGGIGNSIGRFYSISIEEKDFNGYFYACIKLICYVIAIIFAVSFLLNLLLAIFINAQYIKFAVAIVLLSILSGINSYLSSIQNAARQRAIVALHAALDVSLKIIFALLAMYIFGYTSTVVIVGYIISIVIVVISQFIFMWKLIIISDRKFKNINTNYWIDRMLNYALPFSAWGLFTWIQQISDRWALERFTTISDVGNYVAIFQFGYSPTVILSSMSIAFISPIIFEKVGDATIKSKSNIAEKIVWRLAMLTLFISFISFIVLLNIHDWIITFLVAEPFRESSKFLPWIMLSGGMFATGQIFSVKLMSELKSYQLTVVKIVTAVIGILLNIVGAWLLGILGVVMALLAFSIIYLAWMAFLAKTCD